MISGITTKLISKLGDSAGSIVPVIAKDTGNSIGVTLIHSKNGGERDGKEKAIEEFGTEAIWLGGIPLLKKVFDLSVYKIAGIDPKFDIRKLNPKNVDNIDVMIKQATDSGLANQADILNHIKNNKFLATGLFIAKFATATVACLVALTALIKYKQKTTEHETMKKILAEKQAQNKRYEEKIGKSLNAEQAFGQFHIKNNQPAFKGIGAALGDYMFNPLKNMSILDAGIFTTRVKHARKGEKFEIGLKEVMNFAFIYILAEPIQKGLEALSKVFKRPIDLDYRVLSDEGFKSMLKNGDALKDAAKNFGELDGDKIIEAIFKKGGEHDAVVQLFKRTGEIKTLKNGDVSALHLIDPSKLKKTADHMGGIVDAFKKSNLDVDKYISQTRKLKAGSIFANIGLAVLFVGILQPTIAILSRKIKSKGQSSNNAAIENLETNMRNSLS